VKNEYGLTGVHTLSEETRIQELLDFDVLDTVPEPGFDRITLLSKTIFQVPFAYISFIDTDRQWFKSTFGIHLRQTPREHAICNFTIQQSSPLVIPDTTKDERTQNNPLVVGPPMIRFYAGAPLISRNNEKLGALCIADHETRDLSPDQIQILESFAGIVMSELELRRLAGNDVLTGALTRRFFEHTAAATLAQAKRSNSDTSLLLLDLDHFKSVNDAHGHAAGDRALKGTIAVCKSVLRSSDMIGRYGGEEFCVLLPNTSLQDATDVAERLRKAIETIGIDTDNGPLKITASFGIAEFRQSDVNISNFLKRADAALYRAKNSGRNRIVVDGKDIPAPTAA
jgi:diguanylate cyclase (GGDEF)-like protein